MKTTDAFGGSTVEEEFRNSAGFTAANSPIFLQLEQEVFLYPDSQPFDKGVLTCLERRGVQIDEPKVSVKKALITPESRERIRLDQLLDAAYSHKSPQNIYDEDGFSQHGHGCVGAIPITRGAQGIQRRSDFLKDFAKAASEFKKTTEPTEEEKEKCKKEVKKLEEVVSKERLEEILNFGHALTRCGLYVKEGGKVREVIDREEVYKNPELAGMVVTDHTLSLFEKYLPSLPFSGRKELNLQWLNYDGMITELRFDGGNNRWKCHGWFYVLDVPNNGKYVYFRDNSSHGSWVIKDGNVKTEILSLENLAELDKSDPTLKVAGKGNVGLVKNFVKEKDGKVQIQMTRTQNKGVSPIYNVLLGKLGEKWSAEIRMGEKQPGSELLPQHILQVSTY